MDTFLFDDIIFGPVKSRRLGISLGINLLPTKRKVCTFDCIYCECGLNEDNKVIDHLPKRAIIMETLAIKIEELLKDGVIPDVITFAGNGEPTIHPDFEEIINDTIEIRNKLIPNAKIAVLTNSTQLNKPHIFRALKRIDNPILKLDAGNNDMVQRLDKPFTKFSFDETIKLLIEFGSNSIIQTMFLCGTVNGEPIDNSTDSEVEQWLEILKKINPKEVMIYTIDRATPIKTVHKIGITRLNEIRDKVSLLGFKVQVSG